MEPEQTREFELPRELVFFFPVIVTAVSDIGDDDAFTSHGNSVIVQLPEDRPALRVTAIQWLLDVLQYNRLQRDFRLIDVLDAQAFQVKGVENVSITDLIDIIGTLDTYAGDMLILVLLPILASLFGATQQEKASNTALIPPNDKARTRAQALARYAHGVHQFYWRELCKRDTLYSLMRVHWRELTLVERAMALMPPLGPVMAACTGFTLMIVNNHLVAFGSGALSLFDEMTDRRLLSTVRGPWDNAVLYSVASGKYNVAVVCSDGCWLFDPHATDGITKQLIQIPNTRILFVALGASHLVLMTDRGLFSLGDPLYGQLGTGESAVMNAIRVDTPQPITLPVADCRVLGVACGANHTVVTTDRGVFASGRNHYGQLGLGDFVDRHTPTLVPFADGVVVVVTATCGDADTTAFLTASRSLLMCGKNTPGRLGVDPPGRAKLASPTFVPGVRDVLRVACGHAHTLVQTTTGLYAAGRGPSYGWARSGRGDIWTPMDIGETAVSHTIAMCVTMGSDLVLTEYGLYVIGNGDTLVLSLPGPRHDAIHFEALRPVNSMLELLLHNEEAYSDAYFVDDGGEAERVDKKRINEDPLPESERGGEETATRKRLMGLLCAMCDSDAFFRDSLRKDLRFCADKTCYDEFYAPHFTTLSKKKKKDDDDDDTHKHHTLPMPSKATQKKIVHTGKTVAKDVVKVAPLVVL